MSQTAGGSSGAETRPGAVVLAAYRPDPQLFAAQLRSIQNQTRPDFVCLIGADGGPDDVATLVRAVVGDDDRFRVLGWDDRRGVYGNFERVLEAVPPECSWVALSDQDDVWLPDKLKRLVPFLARYSLVTGQARVVTSGAARVLVAKTARRAVEPEALLMQNQVTGAFSVFRTELLDLALPFPRVHVSTQMHDHWLAMCAAASDGYTVLDEVVQDYVQHAGNVIGEAGARRRALGRVRTVRALAVEYESDDGLLACVRVSRTLSFGWRDAMLDALLDRLERPPAWLIALGRRARDRSGLGALRTIAYAVRSPDVEAATTLTFVAGLPGKLLYR